MCEFVAQGHVVMGNNAVSPYQQVIEKTKSLSFRSQMLAMNIEKRVAHSNRNEVNSALRMSTSHCLTELTVAFFFRRKINIMFSVFLQYTTQFAKNVCQIKKKVLSVSTCRLAVVTTK